MIKLFLILLLASDCQAIVSVVNHNGDSLKVDGSGVTQPISSTVLDNILAALGSVPVTGGFYQATQPVSIAGTINTAITNATLAVTQSGAWSVATTLAAETTKVIGTVNIAAGQSIGVTGTFWQATQPVTGTFYQATQPVSLAVAPTTPVTGTFYQATQPISAAALPLPTGAATETTLSVLNTRIATGSPLIVTSSTATLKSAGINLSATGTVVAAVAGKRLRVYCFDYIVSAACTVNWQDNDTDKEGAGFAHSANSGRVKCLPPSAYIFETTSGNALKMKLTGTCTVGGMVSYWEE